MGARAPAGRSLPQAAVAGLLTEIARTDLAPLAGLLDRPHAYAGGDNERVMLEQALPLLPAPLQPQAERAVQDAHTLPPVTPRLVHGDLAGANIRVHGDRVVAVLDWDLASPFDPAVDAACASWFVWDVLAQVVDAQTLHRARVWYRTFPLEQIAAAVLSGATQTRLHQVTARAAAWMRGGHTSVATMPIWSRRPIVNQAVTSPHSS